MLFQKGCAGFRFQPASFAETAEKIRNPGRGFYEIHTFALGQKWDLENLRWCIRPEHTLALAVLDIRQARERELAVKELSDIDAMLGAFGTLGTDILLRVVYDREGRGMQNEPALLSRVCGHMRQLSPVIQAHREHILLLQGLLVGSWGEMHTSKFLQPASIRQLAEVWLEETDLCVAVRTPAFHRILSGHGPAGGTGGRLALYNDGLFGSETDLGTYEDREKDLEYLQESCRRSLNGGEAVCGAPEAKIFGSRASKPKAFYPGAEEIVDRMRRLHIAYLNNAHDVRMLEHFKSLGYKNQTLYDYIEGHMGYRFAVTKAAARSLGERGVRLEIQVKNMGFGNLCQEAEAFLVLEGQDGQRRELPLAADPRLWDAGTTTVIYADISDPATATAYLSLRRREGGGVLQFANQGQREGLVTLGSLRAPQPPRR